jgi:hypothetical protein
MMRLQLLMAETIIPSASGVKMYLLVFRHRPLIGSFDSFRIRDCLLPPGLHIVALMPLVEL